MKTEFDLTDLCAEVSQRLISPTQDGVDTRYTPSDVRDVLRAAFSAIADALVENGGRVELHEFGVFRLELRPPDSGTLPDGGTWQTPERNKVVFRPAPALLRIISDRTGMPVY